MPFHCFHLVSWGINSAVPLEHDVRFLCGTRCSRWRQNRQLHASAPAPAPGARHGPAVGAPTQIHLCTGPRLAKRRCEDSPCVISLRLFRFICCLFVAFGFGFGFVTVNKRMKPPSFDFNPRTTEAAPRCRWHNVPAQVLQGRNSTFLQSCRHRLLLKPRVFLLH